MQYDKSPKCTRSPWETVMKSVKTNINENDVVVALQNMKNGKASSIDGIVTEHITAQDILLIHILNAINQCNHGCKMYSTTIQKEELP